MTPMTMMIMSITVPPATPPEIAAMLLSVKIWRSLCYSCHQYCDCWLMLRVYYFAFASFGTSRWQHMQPSQK